MPELELLDGVAELPRDDWNALVGDQSPFLEWDWLASLEESGCLGPESGWQPRPLVARENGRLLAACPLYVKGHSEGEFVFDWGWADAAERAGIRYYPKLLVGVPFTPVTGARFLVAADQDRARWIPRLGQALQEICAANEFSSVHVNFCEADETQPFEDSEYLQRVGIQYHWNNHGYRTFDDYLDAFRSKKRNQIRRERRAMQAAGVEIEVVSGDEIGDELFEPMYQCYLTTIQTHYYGRQYLNQKFFELLRERFKQRLCFVVARRGSEILAGTTNVVKDGVFYGRYWGALEPVRHLHFNVCYYAAIEWCIERGLSRFEPGAGGDYKWLRGFDASPTYSMHYLRDPRLADAVGRFLQRERLEAENVIDQMGRQSPLKRTRRSETPAPRR